MLPVKLLTPILDVLRQLVTHYGVTIVLCTATQPDFESRQGFEGLDNIWEIIPLHVQERHFGALKRVEYQLPAADGSWTWEQVAERVQAEQQILVIVNTRRDAAELMDRLRPGDTLDEEDDPALFHLSTRLCGMHRRVVLDEVRRRLLAKEPCRLIATQVIEAGVDVDFPLVMRAVGPLDRIVQAAGRANREGKMEQPGKVIIFLPSDGRMPRGSYLVGSDITKELLKKGPADLHDPGLYQEYFRKYYGHPYLDYYGIQELRWSLNYPEVANKFHMIEDDSTSVIVKYSHPWLEGECPVKALLKKLSWSPNRECLRALQPYTVNLHAHEFKKAQELKLVQEVVSGVWEWQEGHYDSGLDGKHGQGILLDGVSSAESNIW